MAVKKAVRKAVKKAKPVKAVKKAVKAKKAKKKENNKITARQIYEIVAENLQANSDGEFDLPSVLVRYTDKSHPKYSLGLHREYFVSNSSSAKFYPSDTEKAEVLFHNQASVAMGAFGEGIKVRYKKFQLPLCKDCR